VGCCAYIRCRMLVVKRTLDGQVERHGDLLPVSVPDARVTDDVQQCLVSLELLDLSTHAVGHVARRWLVGERFTQLV